MSANRKKGLALFVTVGAAFLALAAIVPARAQTPDATRDPKPAPLSSQRSALNPAPQSAVLHSFVAASTYGLPRGGSGGTGPSCSAATTFGHFDHPLSRTARRLASGQPVVIVAIGSSSTAGAGASSPEATYPSRLAVELRRRFPGHKISVLNRGVNGEETADMLARFATAVIAEHPQLVLWQIGTNSVLRDHPVRPHSTLLHEGIDMIRADGADVVLIDPQYAPKVLAKSRTPGMLDLIALIARHENVDLFHRFDVMHGWYESQHHAFGGFISPDGLHMNDWGYACWAKLLAAAIADAAASPVASVAAPPPP